MKESKFTKLKSRIIFITIVVIIILFVALLIIMTPLGNSIVKKIVEIKIEKYIPGAKITYLDYGVDNFSLTLKKQGNILKIYGAMFPLNAMFEANIKNMSVLDPSYRGKMSMSGKIYKKNNRYIINGMCFFADGYMNFILEKSKKFIFQAQGQGFQIQDILYMLKINHPWIKGVMNIKLKKEKKKPCFIEIKAKGQFSHILKDDFNSTVYMEIKNKKNFHLTGIVYSKTGVFDFKGGYNNGWDEKIIFKHLNLSRLRKITLYPFEGLIKLYADYESSDDNSVLKFHNPDISGYISSDTGISFNMNSKKFFQYLGIKELIKGNISGTLTIKNNKGSFDIVCNNVYIVNKNFIKQLYEKTGVNLSNKKIGRVFIKGIFDNNKVKFTLLSTNQNLSISIKKGIYKYSHKYDLMFYLRRQNDIYKLNINSGKFKLLEKHQFRPQDNQIWVF